MMVQYRGCAVSFNLHAMDTRSWTCAVVLGWALACASSRPSASAPSTLERIKRVRGRSAERAARDFARLLACGAGRRVARTTLIRTLRMTLRHLKEPDSESIRQ